MSRIRGLDAYLTRGDPALDVDPTCGAFSPDGKYTCGRYLDHGDDNHDYAVLRHEAYAQRVLWAIDNCDGQLCEECLGPPDMDGFPTRNGKRLHNYTAEADMLVTIAEWPRRDDDFDEEGNPTPRGSAREPVRVFDGAE